MYSGSAVDPMRLSAQYSVAKSSKRVVRACSLSGLPAISTRPGERKPHLSAYLADG